MHRNNSALLKFDFSEFGTDGVNEKLKQLTEHRNIIWPIILVFSGLRLNKTFLTLALMNTYLNN